MNTAIILAGGTGIRMGENIPKQYLLVGGKPIFSYCLETFEKNALIDEIVIVAAEEWREFILQNMGSISKFKCFAPAGSSRQHSILMGLKTADPNTNGVVIHDAVRPNVTDELITACIQGIQESDCALPVLPMKDTIIRSENGAYITGLLNRDQLFAGQTPEGYRYEKYLAIHEGVSEEVLSTLRGSPEIAFQKGLQVKLIDGDEHNYKITTNPDLVKFRFEVENR